MKLSVEFQTAEERVEVGFVKVSHAGVAVTLDDELKLVGKKRLMPVNLDGLCLFSGEEGLEAALDFAHRALGLFVDGLESFHCSYGVCNVVPQGDIEPVNGIQFNLGNLVAYTHISHVEKITVHAVDRDIDNIHRPVSILVGDGNNLLDYRELAVLGKKGYTADECDKNGCNSFHGMINYRFMLCDARDILYL